MLGSCRSKKWATERLEELIFSFFSIAATTNKLQERIFGYQHLGKITVTTLGSHRRVAENELQPLWNFLPWNLQERLCSVTFPTQIWSALENGHCPMCRVRPLLVQHQGFLRTRETRAFLAHQATSRVWHAKNFGAQTWFSTFKRIVGENNCISAVEAKEIEWADSFRTRKTARLALRSRELKLH